MKRRLFLGSTALATATVAAAPALGAAAPVASSAEFDHAGFEAIMLRDARHKQVCASTKLQRGRVIDVMFNSIDGIEKGFGEGPGSLHSVAVLYGTALTLALDDAMWTKYAISANLAALPEPDLVPKAPLTNPFAADVAKLVAGGSTFFVCNNALRGASAYFAGKLAHGKATPEQAKATRDEFVAHMLPGVMVVPAGVAAITLAQEHRFSLVQATL